MTLQLADNLAWINGLMHAIIRDRLMRSDFVETRTEGLDAVKKVVVSYTLERETEIAGVPADLIVQAAHLFTPRRNVIRSSIRWTLPGIRPASTLYAR